MRKAAILLALALGSCSAAPRQAGGIVSTNPCADALLLALVPPGRIAAISHYSKDPGASSIPIALARRLPSTAGTAEEVIAMRPDLVVASSFTPPATLAAYRRLGLKVLLLGSPQTIADSEAQVAAVAAAVGAPQRGRALTARIDAAVRQAAPASGAPRPRTLLYLSGSLATGPGTLLHEMMTIAGLRNAAADYGLAATGTVALDALAARAPDLILVPDPNSRQVRRRAEVLGPQTRTMPFARALINCGGPAIVPALHRLAAVREAVS